MLLGLAGSLAEAARRLRGGGDGGGGGAARGGRPQGQQGQHTPAEAAGAPDTPHVLVESREAMTDVAEDGGREHASERGAARSANVRSGSRVWDRLGPPQGPALRGSAGLSPPPRPTQLPSLRPSNTGSRMAQLGKSLAEPIS